MADNLQGLVNSYYMLWQGEKVPSHKDILLQMLQFAIRRMVRAEFPEVELSALDYGDRPGDVWLGWVDPDLWREYVWENCLDGGENIEG